MGPQIPLWGLVQRGISGHATETIKGIVPPLEWLEILFKGAEFPLGQGLYYMPKKPGETVTADQYVLRLEPLVSHYTNEIGGIRVWFLGFEFALLVGNLMPGVPTLFDGALYRPAGLQAVGSGTQVRLDWKGGARSDEVMFALVTGTGELDGVSISKGLLVGDHGGDLCPVRGLRLNAAGCG